MSLKFLNPSKNFRKKSIEAVVWLGAIGISTALGLGVYSLAGRGFITTIDDPLALPKELVVTSRDASIPLPPQLASADDQPVTAEDGIAESATTEAPSPDGQGAGVAQAAATPSTGSQSTNQAPTPQQQNLAAPQQSSPAPTSPNPAPAAPNPAPPAPSAPAPATPAPAQPQTPGRQMDSGNSNGLVINPTQTVGETVGKLRGITQ